MKYLSLFIILVLVNSQIYSQNMVLKFEKDSTLTHILNSISFYKIFNVGEINVSIIVVANESGSANQPETDEVSFKVYIGVSESDQNPKQLLYSVNNIIAPKDFEVTRLTSNEGILKFNYNRNGKKIPIEINITINGMTRIK